MRKYVLLAVLALVVVTLFAVTAAPASATTFVPKSPGYWMNHPGAWLNGGVCIGGHFYTTAEAIPLMKAPVAGDMRYAVFQALAAAEQNKAHGAGDYWDGGLNAFMADNGPFPGGVAVLASSAAFQAIAYPYTVLGTWWD